MEAEHQEDAAQAAEANGYPAYQLVVAVKPGNETLYCSAKKVKSHAEGST